MGRKLIGALLSVASVGALHAVEPRLDVERMLADLRYLSSDQLGGRRIGSEGSRMARRHLVKELEAAGLSRFGGSYVHTFGSEWEGASVEGANVVGFVEGRESAELFLVLTAHYDHLGSVGGRVFNGADDNASGTAALLALARYCSAHPPRHSIIFAAFDGEETDKRGSAAFVSDPPVELGAMAINVNLDMISHAERELHVAGTYHYPWLAPYVERVRAAAPVELVFGHDRPELGADDWTDASDHAAFHQAGIPFLYFGVEDHQDYHRPSDDFEAINPEFYAAAADTVLSVVLELDGDLARIRETR